MSVSVDFFWDFASPFAYLANTQRAALEARTRVRFVDRPVLLGAVLRAHGEPPVPLAAWSDARRRYALQDLQRWVEFWRVPFRFPTLFPVASVRALRAFLLLSSDKQSAFRDAAFRAVWVEDRDISLDVVLGDLLGDDADAVLGKLSDPATKQLLVTATDYALRRGVFGAPTWVLPNDDLFWGQDRIAVLERALGAEPSF
jgi:2-hydroxychromene-2-carboxylate isomerase